MKTMLAHLGAVPTRPGSRSLTRLQFGSRCSTIGRPLAGGGGDHSGSHRGSKRASTFGSGKKHLTARHARTRRDRQSSDRAAGSQVCVETRFTSGLDPEPRSRPVFAFHRPETPRQLLKLLPQGRAIPTGSGARGLPLHEPSPTFLTRLRAMPPLFEQGLWSAQITAIKNLEKSLAANKPRALNPDGHGLGQDLHRHQLPLPAHQVRRRAARAVPGRPRQPRPAD